MRYDSTNQRNGGLVLTPDYIDRFADTAIRKGLTSSGAVLIRGPKGCGKTYTAEQFAASEIFVDTDPRARGFMDTDPALMLRGAAPRLLDEWQVYPELWNYVRREVDARQEKGQFVLTGSANPADNAKIHSGVGRFSVVTMRPMSRVELGLSNAGVSLAALLNPNGEPDFRGVPERIYSMGEVARQLVTGGWPGLLHSGAEDAAKFAEDYISLTSETDISRVDDTKRDPFKVKRLLQSYARNIATQAAVSSMVKDARGEDSDFTEATAFSYINALERLMIIDNLPAWNTHIRSTVALRTTPKRHFADPSLAVGALKLSWEDLMQDLNFTGYLFESSVIRDLRVYADAISADVSFFRDAKEREVDAIVQRADGAWAGFEIKLGDVRVDDGAEALLKLMGILDFGQMKKPSSLNVVTSSGFPYRRKDGVNVIPASVLTA
jgi:predicted AAA+ superfamily ATPase